MNTAMLLAARFESPTVPLEQISDEFFGLSPAKAARQASARTLPVAAMRLTNSQKAPWLVHVDDLAAHIDATRATARAQWANSATAPR
ncbi:pyocin activator PrtN family protein [Chitinimonas koreensis]|uniref:pyocin activator PrtN family protein n=1 Tax=Chitinimonas koreensis TaxID=356302 RepID=UPI0003F5FBBD|nr:pyocin activator PrtN family protein [Chitinimonas koreensis]QNM96412.1 pyocin activator PrtN family protein [Chitinimonas koreensis]